MLPESELTNSLPMVLPGARNGTSLAQSLIILIERKTVSILIRQVQQNMHLKLDMQFAPLRAIIDRGA